jgi:hypothetical protein
MKLVPLSHVTSPNPIWAKVKAFAIAVIFGRSGVLAHLNNSKSRGVIAVALASAVLAVFCSDSAEPRMYACVGSATVLRDDKTSEIVTWKGPIAAQNAAVAELCAREQLLRAAGARGFVLPGMWSVKATPE